MIALVLTGSCGGLSKHDNSDTDQNVALTRAALTASPSLPAAVAGKIVAPNNSFVNAGTPGEPGVGHDGSASYRIPLWVPDGVNGLQPNLAVEYNSEAGMGILGPRWRLTGFSAITRCPKTLAQDGIQRPVDFFGNTFCLDGQRLTIVGDTASSSELRTERETFTKIVGYKDANGDFTSFTAWQRDGLILRFGTTFSSRLHGTPRRLDGTLERDVSYAYYLDKIEDRYGNAVTMRYRYVLPSAAVNQPQVSEPVPDSITWGPGNVRSLSFNYRPAAATTTRSVSGLSIVASKLLSEIEVRGPDGQGGAPILKVYGFGYSSTALPTGGAPIVTGDLVLAQIYERDDAWYMTYSTYINWEPGAVTHTRVDLDPTNEADFSRFPYTGSAYIPPDGPQTDRYERLYRRIIATDLDEDGRDDIVYRGYVPDDPTSSGRYCVGWRGRRTLLDANNLPTLAPAATLALGSDPDTGCRSAAFDGSTSHFSGGNAWPGDIIFADLNNDGFPDIISPVGRSSGFDAQGKQTNILAGYRAYLNRGASAPGTFGNPINFLDSVGLVPSLVNFANRTSRPAALTIGDLDGDGYSEILRFDPSTLALTAATVGLGGLTSLTENRNGYAYPYFECPAASSPNCAKNISYSGFGLGEDIDAADLDGDGTSEIIGSLAICNIILQPCDNAVISPTLNGRIVLGPARKAFSTASRPARAFLDLNADGLPDVAWLDGANWRAALGTGRGFGTDTATPIPTSMISGSGWAEFLPIDFNLDGRQDLLVNAATTAGMSTVLISNGNGGFVRQEHPIPPVALDQFTGRVDRVVADLNGDGLPDIVQLEAGKLVAYVRGGNAPAMVTRIEEGNGRTIDFAYAVANGRDPAFYDVRANETCQTAPDRLTCLNRGRWLTRSLTVSGGGRNEQQTFSYQGGVFDKKGRGFLGFVRRHVDGPGTRRTDFTYAPIDRLTWPGTQVYDYKWAMTPYLAMSCVDTGGTNPTSCERQESDLDASWQSNGVFRVLPKSSVVTRADCPSSLGPMCAGQGPGYRRLAGEERLPTFDAYGNVTNSQTKYYQYPNGIPALYRTDTEVYRYSPNTNDWLLNLFDPNNPSTVTSQTISPAETVTRTTKYSPDTTHGGIASFELEPNTGASSTHLSRTFGRDTRGRLQTVTDYDFSSATSRATTFFYQEDTYDDGVYPWKITNQLGHQTTIRRHPGLGVVVEVVDPNGIASTRSYDTFQRLRSETDFSGAFTKLTYPDPAGGMGPELWIEPEGLASRRTTIRLDPFGQEVMRSTPVSADRRLETHSIRDALGRIGTRFVNAVNADGSWSSNLNTFSLAYDGLDRLTSQSHFVSDGSWQTSTNTYDGLQVTSTNEAGRQATRIFDGMGRLAIERTTLDLNGVPTVSDATYTYRPFGSLKQVTSGGSAQTSFEYDVWGRQTSVTRPGTGKRGTAYNAFGDVTSSYKVDAGGAQVEQVTYARDSLGRPTSITASDITTRRFYWDAPASTPGTPAPGGIGKLVDVTAGGANVHYDYYDASSPGSGLLKRKTWSGGSSWQSPGATLGTADYSYDAQGRLSTLQYPKVSTWSTALTVSYDYSPYSGKMRAIKDTANPTVPLWELRQENDLGQTTEEWLQISSSPVQKRTTSYYLPTGQVNTSTLLASSSSESQLGYTYESDGLPSTYTEGTNQDIYTHDNLGRLTSWKPSAGATAGPSVSYRYDLDGNLTFRGWTGGSQATYAEDATSRTVSISGSGTTTYLKDTWGRIYDTPAATMLYNSLDEVRRITPKPGSVDTTMFKDGFGERVITQFGSSTTYTFTFDDLAELKRTGSTWEERLRLRDDGGRLIGELVRTTNTTTRTGTFFLTNNVGSVVAEVSSSGAITSRSRRDPFGNLVTSVTNPALPSDSTGSNPDGSGRMAYADHPRDSGWGLVDMGARMYSPRLGRFISPDPIIANVLNRRDHNAFAYAYDSPAAASDPDGRAAEAAVSVPLAVGAALAGC